MKHNLKKVISLVLVLALSLAISVPAFADTGLSNTQQKIQAE